MPNYVAQLSYVCTARRQMHTARRKDLGSFGNVLRLTVTGALFTVVISPPLTYRKCMTLLLPFYFGFKVCCRPT